NLKPLDVRKVDITTVINRIQPKLVAANGLTLYLQPVQDLTVEDRVSRTQYQYSLEDPSGDELNTWTNKLVTRLKTIPALRNVATDQQNDGWEEHIVIDRLTASRLGITPNLIDNTLYDAFGQRQVSTMFTQLNQYRVVLEVKPEFRRSAGALRDIYVTGTTPGANGPQPVAVPLDTMIRTYPTTAPLVVSRQGQFPAVTLSFNLARGAALGDAVAAVEATTHQLGLPASIQGSFQGTAQAFRAALANEPLLILAALVAVYIVLGVLYESYIHPLTILSTLPSAGVGAILALLVCREELSVIALIGIILLIGIVKKNAIMMIDFALEAERGQGQSPGDAIYQACLLRFRPIMMTTMAALLGALPLALGRGVGSELRRPLGIAIVGGLIVSQLLTLYTTPVIYLAFDRLARRFRRAPAEAAEPTESA
ncbi:MAG TPA: efflux RND transporter permease subunit, partial [Methylomirabilota bacterium]|nr:efflux RND transporter permease subunit [Methylomirabilota bacterium]